MKRHLLIALILVLLVAVILLRIQDQSAPFSESGMVNGSSREEGSPLTSKNARRPSRDPVSALLPRVTMTSVEYKIDPVALSHERENSPFEFRGGAGTGRVVDRQGRVLLESSAEMGVFGAVVSPDKKKVLVRGGDGKSLILEPSENQKTVPPYKPPGSNLFPFDWHWIGPDLLFGVSGVEKACDELGHENCCGENNVAQTKFYTFDLIEARLSEVVMPSAVTQPVVNVVDVMSDGHVHLMHEEPHEGVEQDLGWFKIDAAK